MLNQQDVTINSILQLVETRFPNELPPGEISSYELGVLIGQQYVVQYIKQLLKED